MRFAEALVRAFPSRLGCAVLGWQGQLNGMREVPEEARESDGLAWPEAGGSARFRCHADQDLCPSQHRGGLKDVDHPPVVVTPGLPRGSRGVLAEDLIQSGPHARRLLLTELHVAQRDDHSVTRHCSMLRVHGKVVTPSAAVRFRGPTQTRTATEERSPPRSLTCPSGASSQ